MGASKRLSELIIQGFANEEKINEMSIQKPNFQWLDLAIATRKAQ